MRYSLFIVRDSWEQISPKAKLVVKICRENSSANVFYIIRNNKDRFLEKWSYNKIELATSTSGILFYYLLIMLKSPRDLHNKFSRRFFKREVPYSLVTAGFISVLSKTLNHYFAASARSDRLMPFLKEINSKRVFIIDEFTSIKTLDLKLLKQLGLVIYVSQDVANENFDFHNNFVSKSLMYKLECEILKIADLVITCSERDQFRYIDMGAKNAIFYPNIYPIKEFEPSIKDEVPSLIIAFQSRWGDRSIHDFYSIFEALSKVNGKLKVYAIGVKPKHVPRNIEVEYYEYITNKSDYMRILSKSWIGINIGIHRAGSNERKYDYAMAGLVVFSDTLGCRGDLLPHEYTFLDDNDLAAKLEQFMKFSKEKITEMGLENQRYSLSFAEKQLGVISKSIRLILPEDSTDKSYV